MTSISDTNVVNAPGGLVELGYSQITSSVFPATTTFPASTEVIAPLTVVCDGSPIIVEFWCCYAKPANTADQSLTISLFVDGVENQRYWGYLQTPASANSYKPVHLMCRLTPSAGVHTFGVKALVSAGTGTIGAGAGGGSVESPAFLRVSKIIQASQLIVQTPNAPLVTSLPSNAIDGQEVRYLVDNTNGIVWNFRYRSGSSSSYKWEFIGGPPMNANYQGGVYSAGTTWAALGANTNMSLPLTGDYDIKFGGYAYPAANGIVVGLSPNATGLTAPNGTTGTANESGIFVDGSANAIQNRVQLAGYYRAKGISGTLSLYGYASTNSTSIYRPYIIATPVRVTA